jgi:phosphoglycolate phosphatase
MCCQLDAILFDLDGVIVDSRTAIARCINHALAAHGLSPRADEELHRCIGPPLAVAFAELTGQPADSAAVIACVGTYRERYVDASLRETDVTPVPAVAGRLLLAYLEATHRAA